MEIINLKNYINKNKSRLKLKFSNNSLNSILQNFERADVNKAFQNMIEAAESYNSTTDFAEVYKSYLKNIED